MPRGGPYSPNAPPDPNQQPPPPGPVPPRRRFRLWLLTIPLTIAFFLYLVNGMHTSFDFSDLIDALGIHNPERFVQLFVVFIVLVALVLVLCIATGRDKNDD